MEIKNLIMLPAVAVMLCGCGGQSERESVAVLHSPDGKLAMEFTMDGNGKPEYSLKYGDEKE